MAQQFEQDNGKTVINSHSKCHTRHAAASGHGGQTLPLTPSRLSVLAWDAVAKSDKISVGRQRRSKLEVRMLGLCVALAALPGFVGTELEARVLQHMAST